MDSFDQEVANMFYSVKQITKNGRNGTGSEESNSLTKNRNAQAKNYGTESTTEEHHRLQLAQHHQQHSNPAQFLHATPSSQAAQQQNNLLSGSQNNHISRHSRNQIFATEQQHKIKQTPGYQQHQHVQSKNASSSSATDFHSGNPPYNNNNQQQQQQQQQQQSSQKQQIPNHLRHNSSTEQYKCFQARMLDTDNTVSTILDCSKPSASANTGNNKYHPSGVKVSDRYAHTPDEMMLSGISNQQQHHQQHQLQQQPHISGNMRYYNQELISAGTTMQSATTSAVLSKQQSQEVMTPHGLNHLQYQRQEMAHQANLKSDMLILESDKGHQLQHSRQQSFTSRNREDQSPVYHRARSSCSIGGIYPGVTNTNGTSSTGKQFKRKVTQNTNNTNDYNQNNNRSPIQNGGTIGGTSLQIQSQPILMGVETPQQVVHHEANNQKQTRNQLLTRARSAGKPFTKLRTQPNTMQATANLSTKYGSNMMPPSQGSSNMAQTQLQAAGLRKKTSGKNNNTNNSRGIANAAGSQTQRAKSSCGGMKNTKNASSQPKGEMLLKTDLTGQNLQQVPMQLSPDLSWLVLDDNKICQIGSHHLPNSLLHLSLEKNQIQAIYTTELEQIRNTLKTLSLKQNRLQSIQALSICTHLKDLNLAGNFIGDTMFASTIPSLKKLRKLDISQNQLTNGNKVIETVHSLKGLKILKFSENQMVSQLRIDVGRHFRLRELYLDQNKLQSVTIERSQTTKQQESQLRALNLSCNHIGKYEGGIEGLQNIGKSLLDLNLSQNFLDQVSFVENQKNSLFGLNQLRSLNLSNNQIKTFQWDAQYPTRFVSLKSLDLSYNLITDMSCIKLFEGLHSLQLQANPFELCKQTVACLSSIMHLKDLAIETQKLSTHTLKQVPRVKRINNIPALTIYSDLMQQESRSNAVVGGGAGSGIGPGHMATTLTSFNVSAIANPMSIESPEQNKNLYDNDINAQEKQEIYQQVIQLEKQEIAIPASPIQKQPIADTISAYGLQSSAARFGMANASDNKNEKRIQQPMMAIEQEEFFTLQGGQQQPNHYEQDDNSIVDIPALQQKLQSIENDFSRQVNLPSEQHQAIFERVVNLFQQTVENLKKIKDPSADRGVLQARAQSSLQEQHYSNNDYSTVGQIEPAIIDQPESTHKSTQQQLRNAAGLTSSPYLDPSLHQSPLISAFAGKKNQQALVSKLSLPMMSTPNLGSNDEIIMRSHEKQQKLLSNSQQIVAKTVQQSQLSQQLHLYLPVKYDNGDADAVISSKKLQFNADMLIHSFRPFLAELLNIISYTQLRIAEKENLSNNDILYNVLSRISQSLQLLISPSRMDKIIAENQNQGMFYAVRSKPESLLYYPVFKLILQEGWTGMSTDAFKDLIQSQIQSIQAQIAHEQGLTAEANKSDLANPELISKLLIVKEQKENDMPLSTTETITLDSHRPLTYDIQQLKNTNYNIKTPNMDDFLTKESGVPEEQEDRIRTIEEPTEDEFKHMKSPLSINAGNNPVVRNGKISECGRQPRQQQSQNNSHVKEAQIKALCQELVLGAVKPIPQDLLTESQTSQSAESGNRLVFEKIMSQHDDYKVLKQIFRMANHSKMLSVYKRHDPQTQLLRSTVENLTIGWIGCVKEMQQIADAFEELRTDGLKVTKTVNEIINWIINDRQLLQDQSGEEQHQQQLNSTTEDQDQSKKQKQQWRAVACLVSDRFDIGSQTKQRLVHPCYIIDFQFKLPQSYTNSSGGTAQQQ